MSGNKRQILLVEDEDDHIRLIRRAFESGAEQVILSVASNLRQARAFLAESVPDLIIADLFLPDGKGTELLPDGLEESPYPVVVMTSHGDEKAAVKAIKAGALDYVVKSEVTLADMPHLAEHALREWGHIVERRQAEEMLRIKDIAIAASINAIAMADLEGNVTYVNGAFLKLCGYDDEREVLGKPVVEFWQVKDEAEAVIKALRDGKGWVGELVAKRKDGSPFDVQFSANMAVDEVGKPICMMSSFIDITERKQTEKMIRETEKLAASGRLAARIAHEINNPLAGIKNSFLLIKDAIPQDHQYYEYVGRIDREISRVSQIVRQMFDLYRPGSESPRQFSLREAITDIVALLKVSDEGRNVNVEVGIDDDSAVVNLVEGLFREVLFNVIQNAIEASPSNETVKVTAKVSEKLVTVEVADRGGGIGEEICDHIFEPFFTTKAGHNAASGLGLGLSICKSTVDAMGGSISFKSKKGKGTVFSIVIPLKNKVIEIKNG